jgi:Zn-finger nucleic acid-binding protein
MHCAKCQTEMAPVHVTPVEGSPFAVERCPECNGVWFEAGDLETYLNEGRRVIDSWAIDPERMREFDLATGICPRCGVAMDKAQAPSDPLITIDRCGKCQGSWLDTIELDRLEQPLVPSLVQRFLNLFS